VIHARFIDVDVLDPELFHATYAGIAYALEQDDAPVVMWGRARAHVCLGQSQSREAELAPVVDVPVVTRPLGGGTVWVDESQYCFVLIAPLGRAPARPAEWFGWGLQPAIATFQRFGLPVARREQDLWLEGRKIAGSGAATIGRCAVLASSFLFRFPAERFARCIASPLRTGLRQSPVAFRQWLLDGLRRAMTDWQACQPAPDPDTLRGAFCEAIADTLGWQLAGSALSDAEIAARDDALADLAEPAGPVSQRAVAHGIKLNAASYLTEKRVAGRIVRELVVDGAIVRRMASAA
jgi:lipoate-protein ligase A